MARVWCILHIVSHEVMLRFSLVAVSSGVLNGVRPTALRCDSEVIEGTRFKWVASSYVHGTRFGARVLSLVEMAEPLLLWWHHSCHAALPIHEPRSSYRSGMHVRVWGYGQALRALREVVEKIGA